MYKSGRIEYWLELVECFTFVVKYCSDIYAVDSIFEI